MEFLVSLTTTIPAGVDESETRLRYEQEARRIRQLSVEGHVLRLWRPPVAPGERRALGVFVAADLDALGAILTTLPLRSWMELEIMQLGRHPNDPRLAPTIDGDCAL